MRSRNALLTSALAAGIFMAQLSRGPGAASWRAARSAPRGTAGRRPTRGGHACRQQGPGGRAGRHLHPGSGAPCGDRASHRTKGSRSTCCALPSNKARWSGTRLIQPRSSWKLPSTPSRSPTPSNTASRSNPKHFWIPPSFRKQSLYRQPCAPRVAIAMKSTVNSPCWGLTKPAKIQASFVGTGRSMEGATTLGFTGSMNINWPEYKGAGMATSIGVVTVVLDAEFMGAKGR